MSVEMAAIAITAIGFIGTAFNVYLTLNIRNSVMELKLWSNDRFVAKTDMKYFVQPYTREAIQIHESAMHRSFNG